MFTLGHEGVFIPILGLKPLDIDRYHTIRLMRMRFDNLIYLEVADIFGGTRIINYGHNHPAYFADYDEFRFVKVAA